MSDSFFAALSNSYPQLTQIAQIFYLLNLGNLWMNFFLIQGYFRDRICKSCADDMHFVSKVVLSLCHIATGQVTMDA
jgi:hypothetical protein